MKKQKSRQKLISITKKVVKEVLGGGGNNAKDPTVPKVKGQKMAVSVFCTMTIPRH